MTKQEMGAWYFFWHRVFSVPYSEDIYQGIEELRQDMTRHFLKAVGLGLLDMLRKTGDTPASKKTQ